MSHFRSRRLARALGLVLLAAAGCASEPVAGLAPTSAPPPTTGTPAATAAAPTAQAVLGPLTGLPVAGPVAKRPAIVVAVPLVGGSGLDRADVVFQEYERSTTLRAIAVFQSRDADQVGPVGQVRSVDPALLPILRPLYANAGGGSGVTDLLAKAKVARIPAYGTTSTTAVLAAAPDGALPPPPIFPYLQAGDAFATTQLRRAGSLSITVPGGTAESWAYSAGTRTWTRSGTAGVAVRNLVVQTVEYKAVTLKDPIRSAQSARVLGRGSCYAFSADRYTRCSWYKRSATGLTNYADTAGVPLRFAPGPTWVVLVPPGSALVAR